MGDGFLADSADCAGRQGQGLVFDCFSGRVGRLLQRIRKKVGLLPVLGFGVLIFAMDVTL